MICSPPAAAAADAAWPVHEDAAHEIEALQATYGDDVVIDQAQQQISMLLTPLEDSAQQQYVRCQLVASLGCDYPSEPPAVQLADVKGFSNRQDQLLQQLNAEAAELAGELVLCHLFESAKSWLTAHNCPEGPCIFCLEDLAPVASCSSNSSSNTGCDASKAQQQLVGLPCFHAFHECCFADWWCWQQQAYAEQQQSLEAKTGATAAAALVQEALPAKDGQLFQLACPTCRAPFLRNDLQQHMQDQLQQQLVQRQGIAQQPPQQQQQQQQLAPAATKLTAAQLQPFLEVQQQHARLFAQQQRRQGIIVTDSSYCIADWQGPPPPAVSATAAAAPTESAAAAASALPSSSRGGRGGRSRGVAGRGPGGRGRHSNNSHGQDGTSSSSSSSSTQLSQHSQQATQAQRPHQQRRQHDQQAAGVVQGRQHTPTAVPRQQTQPQPMGQATQQQQQQHGSQRPANAQSGAGRSAGRGRGRGRCGGHTM